MKLSILLAFITLNLNAAHIIITNCANEDGSILYTNNKGYEVLTIGEQVVSEGTEVLKKIGSLNVVSTTETNSCEQDKDNDSAVLLHNSDTELEGMFNFNIEGEVFKVDMKCEKHSQSASFGTFGLCNRDFSL